MSHYASTYPPQPLQKSTAATDVMVFVLGVLAFCASIGGVVLLYLEGRKDPRLGQETDTTMLIIAGCLIGFAFLIMFSMMARGGGGFFIIF